MKTWKKGEEIAGTLTLVSVPATYIYIHCCVSIYRKKHYMDS